MIENIVKIICKEKQLDRPYIVAVNGVDASGKTTFARHLKTALDILGINVCSISIDDFHNPKDRRYKRKNLPLAYYKDSFDFSAFQKSLKKISSAQLFPTQAVTKIHDLDTDKPQLSYKTVDKDTIVIIEGVFIFRKDLIPYYDLKIFLDVNFDEILDRVKIRDLPALGTESVVVERYKQKYIPGQKLYFKNDKPFDCADLVIDNNDCQNPVFINPIKLFPWHSE